MPPLYPISLVTWWAGHLQSEPTPAAGTIPRTSTVGASDPDFWATNRLQSPLIVVCRADSPIAASPEPVGLPAKRFSDH